MIVGFTGTSKGLTSYQISSLVTEAARSLDAIVQFHHGDCVGADAQAHHIIVGLDSVDWCAPGIQIVIHPPVNPKSRAFCQLRHSMDVLLPEKPYLIRNTDIALACDVLWACPKEMHEVLRSGTWSTIRQARRLNRRVRIFNPEPFSG